MDLFKVVAILAVFVVLVVAQDPDSDCGEAAMNDTMTKCVTDAGISMSDVMRFMPTNGMINYTEEDYVKQCAHQDQYVKASECMANEFRRCSPDGMDYMPDMHKVSDMMVMMCNDTSLNITCMVAMGKDMLAIQACVESKVDFSDDAMTSSDDDIFCQTFRASIQCTVDSLRKYCDDHTASVVESMQTMILPPSCDDSPVIG